MKLHIAWLFAILTAGLSAETVSFESAADLTAYSITNLVGTLNQEPGVGSGSPATGGLRYSGPNTNTDRGVVARKAVTVSPEAGLWTTSILINPKQMDDANPTADKAEVRIGFAATDAVNSGKPWEYFHKSNDSISLKFVAEHKPTDGKTRYLECEITNRVTSETNFDKLTVNNSPNFDDWLRVSLTLVRSGATGFTASYTLESLGPDGTSAATQVFSSTPVSLANSTLAATAGAFAGFAVKTEKSRVTSAFIDEHSFAIVAVAPQPPVALAASSVAAQGFSADWEPAATGVSPASYLLEISTAASNFAPGTLISVTGAPGQTQGITVNAPETALAVSGLVALTEYRYRVRAVNATGVSEPSNFIAVQTLAANQNAAPTLDPLADIGPVETSVPSLQVPLTGISSGGEPDQTVTVTAVSSAPGIATVAVSHTSPDSTGTLLVSLGGVEGSATITVTADDGQSTNHLITRSFTITVRDVPAVVDFEEVEDLDEFTVATNSTVTHTFFAGAGAGSPASNGIIVSSGSVTAGDRGFVAYREQGHTRQGATQLQTSLLVNMSQLDDDSSEAKLELFLGFTSTFNLNAGKPDEFLKKTNNAISVSFKGEHKPTDGKDRQLEAELIGNFNGTETKLGKTTAINSPYTNDWLRISFTLTPTGGNGYGASYQIESLGAIGTDTPVVVLQSAVFPFVNETLGQATSLHAAYSGKIDKRLTYLQLDEHTSTAQSEIPSAPLALAADLVTAGSFRANWSNGTPVAASEFRLEVIPDGSTFTSGNFIAADGTPGQAAGINVGGSAGLFLRITGLTGASGYRYRLIGSNLNGDSQPSAEIAVTTLATGVNAPPTLAAIPNPAPIAINGSSQSLVLSGISSGGEDGQTLTVTAVSLNPGLIPNPTVAYTSPESGASLSYQPQPGVVGNAVITVTVSDGAANNSTFSRSFTVKIVDPGPVLEFTTATDLADISVTATASTLVHEAAGGTANTGGIAFQGTVPGADRVAVAIRPTAFDASSAAHFITSIDINAAEILAITTGKDKGDLRLGFMGGNTFNAIKPQETLNKTHASIGVKFKIEQETGSSEKQRNIEAELYWGSGGSEVKGGKLTLNNAPAAGHWLRVSFEAVRSGTGQYVLRYVVDDMGVNGGGFVSRLMESEPVSISNAAFFTDHSVFSAFSVGDEKSGPGNILRLDRFESIVNTTAPDAPATQEITNITHSGFTVEWNPSLLGNPAEGYIVEVVAAGAPFRSGYFYSEDGVPGQTTGFRVENAFSFDATISGLSRLTSYRIRVRAFGESPELEESLALNVLTATTLYGPGLEYDAWRTLTFGANAANEAIAGKSEDPDQDGMNNLLEYAFGFDPEASDAHRLPKADVSGDYLKITYKRRYNVTGIHYEPQAGSDLTGWAGDSDVDGPLESATGPDAEGMQTVVVEDRYEIGVFPSRFLRVKVEEP